MPVCVYDCVQCLANTEPLAQYLVTNRYQADVRRSAGRGTAVRPGARGELTECFATVVKALWTQHMSAEISSEFRSVLSLQCFDAVGWVARRASGL